MPSDMVHVGVLTAHPASMKVSNKPSAVLPNLLCCGVIIHLTLSLTFLQDFCGNPHISILPFVHEPITTDLWVYLQFHQ